MVTQPFSLHGREADVDVMVEAKGMEKALLFYRDELLLGHKQHSTAPAGSCGRKPGAAAEAKEARRRAPVARRTRRAPAAPADADAT